LIYLCNASFDTAARQTINLVWKSMLIIGLAFNRPRNRLF